MPSSGNGAGTSLPLLCQAARDGDTITVKRLLAAGGVDVNAIDPHTRLTPLMLAVRHGHDDVALVLTTGQQGADQTVNHNPGEKSHYPSPLFAAAGTGATAIVRLLLEAGAKHDLKDKDGRTPLQHAIRNEYKEIEALLRNCNPKTS
jgi:ankyrin repeat protein